MKDYLKFEKEECPHCKEKIDIEIKYEVVDRFMVDYKAILKKSEIK